jgi:hypothetical protein
VRLLIALSLLTAIGVAAPTALAAGSVGIGIRLLDVPTDSRHDPLAGSYIVDRLAPGTSIRRRIEITNSTASTATVSLYPAAADLHRGRFAFAAARTPNELSSWTSVSRPLLRVPAGTRTFETVTVAVPKDASHGERHAVVWAEVSAPAAGGGVTLVNRVGVRMYVAIGTGGAAPAGFAIGSLSAERSEDGAPLVVAIVHNTGGLRLDLVGTLTLADGPGGLRAGPFRVHVAQAVVPGASASATVHLDSRLPRGPWTARLHLRSGDVERASTAVIVFPVETVSATPADDAARSPLVAALVVILLALLAIVLLALLLRRRPRRGRRGGIGPAAPVVA